MRSRATTRDMAGIAELQLAVDFVLQQNKASDYHKARDVVCLFLLFITGLRISNLLLMTVQVLLFMDEGHFDIMLIKKKKNVIQTFCIPKAALDIFALLMFYFYTSATIENPMNTCLHQKRRKTATRRSSPENIRTDEFIGF